jgi:selenocysteine lyase/cysteine desulfurase
MDVYWREKSRGTPGRECFFRKQAETEAAAAALLNTPAENVALLGNSSEALNVLANSIDWRPGDEVLISDLEFPSNVIVWLRLKHAGVRLVVIPTRGGIIRLEDWTRCISARTRIVSVSQVSYKTGTQLPFLAELAVEAHRAGALFCVDATQALGRVPVSVNGVDYLVASSYKWLLGTHGLGVVYLSPEARERLRPGTAGWYSVDSVFHPDRFESFTPKRCAGQLQAGMPNFPAVFALKAGVDFLLSIGVDTLDGHLRPLVRMLREGLVEEGLEVLTPAGDEFSSGIVSFACAKAEAAAGWLAGQGVIAWGGDDRIRLSLHVYNDEDDVHRCLEAIRRMPGKLETRSVSSQQ